jgi:hypothetical protein
MSTIAHAEKALEAIKGLDEFLTDTGGNLLSFRDSFSSEHLLNYGEARKIVKANKYKMLLIHNVVSNNQEDYTIFKANDKTILKALAIEVNAHPAKDDAHLMLINDEVLVKVSAKFTASLIVIIKEHIDSLEGGSGQEEYLESLIDVLKVLKKKISTKTGAVDAEKLADAKAHAKDLKKIASEKLADAKAHAKALKKIASDAKKAANVAEKNYEKAEAVVAKMLSK